MSTPLRWISPFRRRDTASRRPGCKPAKRAVATWPAYSPPMKRACTVHNSPPMRLRPGRAFRASPVMGTLHPTARGGSNPQATARRGDKPPCVRQGDAHRTPPAEPSCQQPPTPAVAQPVRGHGPPAPARHTRPRKPRTMRRSLIFMEEIEFSHRRKSLRHHSTPPAQQSAEIVVDNQDLTRLEFHRPGFTNGIKTWVVVLPSASLWFHRPRFTHVGMRGLQRNLW